MKENSRLSHLLLRNMLKRTSEDLDNAIATLDPNNLEGGNYEEEAIEGSELPPAKPHSLKGMISCIQTISGGCSLVSLCLIP